VDLQGIYHAPVLPTNVEENYGLFTPHLQGPRNAVNKSSEDVKKRLFFNQWLKKQLLLVELTGLTFFFLREYLGLKLRHKFCQIYDASL
jgi:hypothetical protein